MASVFCWEGEFWLECCQEQQPWVRCFAGRVSFGLSAARRNSRGFGVAGRVSFGSKVLPGATAVVARQLAAACACAKSAHKSVRVCVAMAVCVCVCVCVCMCVCVCVCVCVSSAHACLSVCLGADFLQLTPHCACGSPWPSAQTGPSARSGRRPRQCPSAGFPHSTTGKPAQSGANSRLSTRSKPSQCAGPPLPRAATCSFSATASLAWVGV